MIHGRRSGSENNINIIFVLGQISCTRKEGET